MKIIFATGIPFIRQHEIDMYVDSISSKYAIEKWDLSSLYGRSNDMTEVISDRNIISSIDEFEMELHRLCQIDNVVFVTNILTKKLNLIYNFLKKENVPIVNINKEGLAAWLSYRAIQKKISLEYILSTVVKNCVPLRILYKRIFEGRARYDYLLSSYNFFPEECHCFYKIHNIKYDEYLSARNSENVMDGEYILFVDAALAGHPMFAKSKNPLDEVGYIKSLNYYFDMLEEKYNLPVVISAHPKSCYNAETFHGRPIIKYKTPELIQHCKYVISHYSTSLVNALLLKKPIKVLTSRELECSGVKKSVYMGIEFARRTNVEIVDLDNPVFNDFYVDLKAYDKFLDKYILNQDRVGVSNSKLIIEFMNLLEGGK